MGVASQLSSSDDFLAYLHQREALSLDELLPRVTSIYRKHQGWDYLLQHPATWFELVNLPHWIDTPPVPSAPFSLKSIDVTGVGLRIALLDEQQRFLIGIPTITPRSLFRPVVCDNRTVGWLVLVPLQQISDVSDHGADSQQLQQEIIEALVPGLTLDEASLRIALHGNWIDLTRIEFRLLSTLAKKPGRVFTRDQLLSSLYTDDHCVTDRAVDCHIKNLRRKLERIVPGCGLVRSVYGVGYKLEP